MNLSKLDTVFKNKKQRVLNMYCTAGFPHLESTGTVMKALQTSGADIIELGIPYSDPIADGPVIQDSNNIAIANGITLPKIFSQLGDLKNEIQVPVILMGYLNPVMQFGFEKFCAEAARVGVSGIILPDLPIQEYDDHYAGILKKFNLQFIFLVTPATSADRIKAFDKRTGGFLYAVSSAGTTGEAAPPTPQGGSHTQFFPHLYSREMTKSDEMKKQEGEQIQLHRHKGIREIYKGEEQTAYFERLQKMKLRHPVLIGFGISDKKSFDRACKYAAGAIIGSAYIKALKNSDDVEKETQAFITSILT